MRFQVVLLYLFLLLTVLCMVEGKAKRGRRKGKKGKKGKGGVGGLIKKGADKAKETLSKSDKKGDDDADDDDDDEDDDDSDRRRRRRRRRRDDDDDDDDYWDDDDDDVCVHRKRRQVYNDCRRFAKTWCKSAAKAATDEDSGAVGQGTDDDGSTYLLSPFRQASRLLPKVRRQFPRLPRTSSFQSMPVQYQPLPYAPQQPMQPAPVEQPPADPTQHHKLTIEVTGSGENKN